MFVRTLKDYRIQFFIYELKEFVYKKICDERERRWSLDGTEHSCSA